MCVLYVSAEHCFEAQVMESSSQASHLAWSTRNSLTVYAKRQDQDISKSETDLWHNSSTGYSLVVRVWSCVCVCQYVDILDQFPLTLVSVNLSLMFHHLGWFLIWLLTAQFSYKAILYAYPVFLCLALRPQAVHQTCVLLMSLCCFCQQIFS